MIEYKSGYKYQLARNYRILVPISGPISQGPIKLSKAGWLTIKKGYAWDGPSGPAIDTKNFMRGSLVHDALYQLMREGRLGWRTGPKETDIDHEAYRKVADQLLRDICREDGMSWIRAWWVYRAVRTFAARAADQDNKRPIITAP